MAVQIRSKRKKSFKSKEAMQFDDPATPTLSLTVEKPEYESSLNVRRSSRKPKPKKLNEDFEEDIPLDVKIKQEPLDEDELTPTVYMSETPVFYTEPSENATSFANSGAAVRRETRKSFQSYLETLGYNRDFSKIPEQELQSEPQQRSRKGKREQINLKTESEENFSQLWPLQNKESSSQETYNSSSKVRASSRTPRPRKTFTLLEEEVNLPANRSGLDSVASTDVQLDTQKQGTRKGKARTLASKKGKTPEHHQTTPTSIAQPTSTPLGKNDVDEPDVMSDETDGTPTRTSGRVRVPKRQFSLLEDESQSDTKREKLTSPEHITSSDVKKQKQKENITSSESPVIPKSSLVVKRSNNKKGKKSGNTVDSCRGKVTKIIEDINIKREVDTTESSQSETEKKTVVKKGRERIEKIVESLFLAKQSDLVPTQEEIPKGKTSSQKKGVKRKRESSGNEKTKQNGKGTAAKKVKKNIDTEKEHIVLKLHIPHGKDKDKTKDEKHHKHHHHHHKHKKAKER